MLDDSESYKWVIVGFVIAVLVLYAFVWRIISKMEKEDALHAEKEKARKREEFLRLMNEV
jgi:Na+-transporting methylmalonyl-CoA/oxaloacetate decarboxylase gamma subunit